MKLWLASLCFASACLASKTGSSLESIPHHDVHSLSKHPKPAQPHNEPHGTGNSQPAGASSLDSQERPPRANVPTTSTEAPTNPYAQWDKSRSGLVLSSNAPTTQEILSSFKNFYSGSAEKDLVSQSLVFWVGRKRAIPDEQGNPTPWSYSLDANQVQAQDFANNRSSRTKPYYTLQNLRNDGNYANTWTTGSLSWSERAAMFDRLSAAMALFATKEVYVFGSPEGFARTDTAWAQIEYPILKDKVQIRWFTIENGEPIGRSYQPQFLGTVFNLPQPESDCPFDSPKVNRPLKQKGQSITRLKMQDQCRRRTKYDKPQQSVDAKGQGSVAPQMGSVPGGTKGPKNQPTGPSLPQDQDSGRPQSQPVSGGRRKPKPKPKPKPGGAQATYPLRSSPGTSQGGKTPKQQPEVPESSQPEAADTGELPQSETQSQAQPVSEPEPQTEDPAQHTAPQSQSGSTRGRGGRSSGGGGVSRGGRKSHPQPRAANIATNSRQKILRKVSSPSSVKSVGVEQGYSKHQSVYHGIDYDALPYWALDEIYLRLVFSEMTEDALYERSEMANLIRDRLASFATND